MYLKKCYQERIRSQGAGVGHRVGGASYNSRIYEFIWYLTHKCSQIIFITNWPDNGFSYRPIPYHASMLKMLSSLYVRLFLNPFTDTYSPFLRRPMIALPAHNHHYVVLKNQQFNNDWY